MSRGPGHMQRAIVAVLAVRPGGDVFEDASGLVLYFAVLAIPPRLSEWLLMSGKFIVAYQMDTGGRSKPDAPPEALPAPQATFHKP